MTIRMPTHLARLAVMAAIAAGAAWTLLAIAAPAVATEDVAALTTVAAVGVVVSSRGDGRHRLWAALTASSCTSMVVFLAISLVLPALGGFVRHNDPPVYGDVTRLADPVTELVLSASLAAVLGCDVLRTAFRARRRAALDHPTSTSPAFNEMIVKPTD